jgi:hypothetical protein
MHLQCMELIAREKVTTRTGLKNATLDLSLLMEASELYKQGSTKFTLLRMSTGA